MKTLMFVIAMLILSAPLAHARCEFVANTFSIFIDDPVQEAKERAAVNAGLTFKQADRFTCQLGERVWRNTWLCEDTPGSCDRYLANMGLGPLADGERRSRETGSSLPGGQGWYRAYPSGERVFCDNMFGCRRGY